MKLHGVDGKVAVAVVVFAVVSGGEQGARVAWAEETKKRGEERAGRVGLSFNVSLSLYGRWRRTPLASQKGARERFNWGALSKTKLQTDFFLPLTPLSFASGLHGFSLTYSAAPPCVYSP